MSLQIRLLGGFEVAFGEGRPPCALAPRLRWLLAVLALETALPVPRARLAELLWEGRPSGKARSSLRQALLDLHKALGPAREALVVEGDAVRLDRRVVETDTERLEAALASGDPDALAEAGRAFRGLPLAGLEPGTSALSAWLAAKRAGMLDRAGSLLERLADASPNEARRDAMVRLARVLLGIDPLMEAAHRALIGALLASGRPREAAEQLERCRRELRAELGVEPDARTLSLLRPTGEPSGPRAAPSGPRAARSRPRAASPATAVAAAPRPVRALEAAGRVPTFGAHRPLGVPSGQAGCASVDPRALDHYLRGRPLIFQFTRAANAAARRAYDAAIAIDDGFAAAHAALGWTRFFDHLNGWGGAGGRCLAAAGAAAARALQRDDRLAAAHGLRGKVLLWSHDHDAALWVLRRAAHLQPDDAVAWFHLGDGLCWSGHAEEGLRATRRALALQPEDFGMFRTIEAFALWMLGDARGAAVAADSALARNPGYAWAATLRAVIHAEAGRLQDARRCAAGVHRRFPSFHVEFAQRALPAALPECRARLVAGWRAAGLPETR